MPIQTMLRYIPILILLGFFLEIASIIWVGRALGVALTLLLIVASAVLGISLFRKTGLSVAAALRAPIRNAATQRDLVGSTAFGTLAGLLFMIPGFFSDIVAVLLLLPPVQSWLVSRMKVVSVTQSGFETQTHRRYETIIDAEAVEIEGEIMPPDERRR